MKYQKDLNKQAALEKVSSMGQEHLLEFYDSLSPVQKESLLKQIETLSLELYQKQKKHLFEVQEKKSFYVPFQTDFVSGNLEDHLKGKELASFGKVACIVLAGGQGSRLRVEGPKGCVPTSLVRKKSLYQLIAEKVKAASKLLCHPLKIAFMTSPINDVETRIFFEKNNFFGLERSQLFFFSQAMWPILDAKGNLFLQAKDQIAFGPNGNGGVFRSLRESGICQAWKRQGIEAVQIIPVDNPLALPFDFELLGFHMGKNCEVTVKTSLRKTAHEKVGIFVRCEGKTQVIEYSELTEKKEEPAVANLGLYCLSLSFIEKVSHLCLPLHKAKKAVLQLVENGKTVLPEVPTCWKFEEFIFDVFPFAQRLEALLYPRELCFAPLKNFEGEDSIETTRSALLNVERKIYTQVTGTIPPLDAEFELVADFYYPTQALLEKWKGKELKKGTVYVETL